MTFEEWLTKYEDAIDETVEDTFHVEAAWLASRKAALEEAAAKCKSRISSGPTSDPMVAGANIALRISHDAILALAN